MTKPLKASGFLGLTTMMVVGLHQFTLVAGGEGVPAWVVGGHAHLGVISILAIVVGFAVPALAVTGTLRTVVTVLLPTAFLWGGASIAALLITLSVTVTRPDDPAGSGSTGAPTADD